MKVSVYSIEETLFEGEAEKVIAKTPLGEITVLDNHLPMVTSLIGPSLRVVDPTHKFMGGVDKIEEKSKVIELSSGFLEVRPESEVVILKGA